MSLARKGFFDTFAQNAALLLTFVAGLLFDRWFGRDGRGEYHLILIAYALLPNLVHLGIEVSARVHAGRNPERAAAIHTAGLLLIAFITVATAAAIALFGGTIQRVFFEGVAPEYLLMAAGLLPLVLYHLLWQGVMIGLGDVFTYARVNMWNRIAQGAAVIVLITFFQPTMRWMVLAIIPIQVATFAVTLGLMARGGRRLLAPVDGALLRQMASFGWVVYAGNFAVSLLQRVDVLIANHFYALGEVGLFGRATMFSDKLAVIASAFERLLYAPLAKEGAAASEAVFLIQKSFRHNLYLNLVGAVALYALAAATLTLLLPDFLGSLGPLALLLVAMICRSFSGIFAAWFTAFRRQPHVPGLINWAVLPVHLGGCWLLTREWGIMGASAATALTFALHAGLFFAGFRLTARGTAGLSLAAMLIPTREDWRYYTGFMGTDKATATSSPQSHRDTE